MHRDMFKSQPPAGLLAAIMLRIQGLERRAARVRLGLYSAAALVFGITLVPALQYAGEQFADSGFYDYLSLFVSNHDIATTYWRELGFSLIESLPSMAILLLIPLCAALWFAARAAYRQAPLAFAS